MSRYSKSSFYNWLKKEIQVMYNEPDFWVRLGEEGVNSKHAEYSYRPKYVFKVLNPTTILVNGTGVIKLPDPIVRIQINPFSSRGSAAKDIFFVSEVNGKLAKWFKSLEDAGLNLDDINSLIPRP